MERPIIYIKPEQRVYLSHPQIYISDLCAVCCAETKTEKKVSHIPVHRFKQEEDGRIFVSVLYLVDCITRVIPGAEVRNMGEQDVAVYYKNPQKKQEKMWIQKGKILFIVITCFLGMGVSIMGYNNDVDMAKVFSRLYETFTGTKPAGPTFMELFYSLGLTFGVFLFFNHVPGRKPENELTPVQVQMRIYEQDVNRAFFIGASRKGKEYEAGNIPEPEPENHVPQKNGKRLKTGAAEAAEKKEKESGEKKGDRE